MTEQKIKKPIFKRWWFWAIVALIVIGAASSGGKDANNPASTLTTAQQEQGAGIVNDVDHVKSKLEDVLLNGNNKDKITVAYKIRDVKKVGENEYSAMIYSDLGDQTNFSGNTYQILDYINGEIISKSNIKFFEISVQYFKKIDGESIRVATYQIPNNQIKPIIDYGLKEGNPLSGLKKIDGLTKEKTLDKI